MAFDNASAKGRLRATMRSCVILETDDPLLGYTDALDQRFVDQKTTA